MIRRLQLAARSGKFRALFSSRAALPSVAACSRTAVDISLQLRTMASASAVPILHQKSAHLFVYEVPEGKGTIEYELEPPSSAGIDSKGKPVLNITHTIVEPGLQGRGVAGKLADEALRYAREAGMAVRPSCSYISDTFLPKGKGEAANWSYTAGAPLAFPKE
jgi:uncharacterized protein